MKKLITIAGIPIIAHYSLLIFMAVLAMLMGPWAIPMTLAMFSFVLVHEYGHALTARWLYGIPCEGIILHGFGGAALVREEDLADREYPWREAVVAIAGPMTSALLGVAFLLLGQLEMNNQIVAYLIDSFAYLNFLLAVFNLLPLYPMDGGRVLRSLIACRWNYDSATVFARRFSMLGAGALAIYGVATAWYAMVIIAVLVIYLNWKEEQQSGYFT